MSAFRGTHTQRSIDKIKGGHAFHAEEDRTDMLSHFEAPYCGPEIVTPYFGRWTGDEGLLMLNEDGFH